MMKTENCVSSLTSLQLANHFVKYVKVKKITVRCSLSDSAVEKGVPDAVIYDPTSTLFDTHSGTKTSRYSENESGTHLELLLLYRWHLAVY